MSRGWQLLDPGVYVAGLMEQKCLTMMGQAAAEESSTRRSNDFLTFIEYIIPHAKKKQQNNSMRDCLQSA